MEAELYVRAEGAQPKSQIQLQRGAPLETKCSMTTSMFMVGRREDRRFELVLSGFFEGQYLKQRSTKTEN